MSTKTGNMCLEAESSLDEIKPGRVFADHDEAANFIEEWSERNLSPLTKASLISSLYVRFNLLFFLARIRTWKDWCIWDEEKGKTSV